MNLEFITGNAGSGKTYTLKSRIQEAKSQAGRVRSYGTLCATTGIASINLSGSSGDSVTTLNSLLKYFDTNSLKDNFAARKLHNVLKEVSRLGRHLVIDELSMMDAEQLDLIHDAIVEVNELQEVQNRGGLGLILSGDFAQLPPVNAPFAFNARCWSNFGITKLTKIWRQDNPDFIECLNYARRGDGERASKILFQLPDVSIRDIVDSHFDGTTIVPVNRLVDSLNKIRLDELLANSSINTKFTFKSFRWGKQLSEWKMIPEERVVCKNAYVMILANDPPEFTYANGSCGYILDANIDSGTCIIKLKDNGKEVRVRRVTRQCLQKETPEGMHNPDYDGKKEWLEKQTAQAIEWGKGMEDIMYKNYLLEMTNQMRAQNPYRPFFNFLEDKWVVGEISYTPLRLAYATTCHKSQGLSLDKVQVDPSHAFFGEPSMMYVALSRVRTPGGLTIVGSRKLMESRTNISSEILEWV